MVGLPDTHNLGGSYKRELFYTVLIFVLWQSIMIPGVVGVGWLAPLISLLGGLLLTTWVVVTYAISIGKGVSRHSDVLIKLNLKSRFFAYFLTPNIFYWSVALFVMGVDNILLRQMIIILSTVSIFFLLVHIRSSYDHIFDVSSHTKFVFLIIDLLMFYIGLTGFVLLGTSLITRVLLAALVAFVLLMHQLLLNKQLNWNGLLITLLSTAFLSISAAFFVKSSVMAYPLLVSVAFYLILSWWYLKFRGHLHIGDYIPPVMFSLMSWIILLSL